MKLSKTKELSNTDFFRDISVHFQCWASYLYHLKWVFTWLHCKTYHSIFSVWLAIYQCDLIAKCKDQYLNYRDKFSVWFSVFFQCISFVLKFQCNFIDFHGFSVLFRFSVWFSVLIFHISCLTVWNIFCVYSMMLSKYNGVKFMYYLKFLITKLFNLCVWMQYFVKLSKFSDNHT